MKLNPKPNYRTSTRNILLINSTSTLAQSVCRGNRESYWYCVFARAVCAGTAWTHFIISVIIPKANQELSKKVSLSPIKMAHCLLPSKTHYRSSSTVGARLASCATLPVEGWPCRERWQGTAGLSLVPTPETTGLHASSDALYWPALRDNETHTHFYE